MIGGRIRQFDTPEVIYGAPAHLDVAKFIGQPSIDLLPAAIDQMGMIKLNGEPAPFATSKASAGAVTVGVRAEAFEPTKNEPANALFALAVRLDRIERLGSEVLVRCKSVASGQSLISRVAADRFDDLSAGGTLDHTFFLATRGRGVHVFGSDGSAVPYKPTRQGLRVAL